MPSNETLHPKAAHYLDCPIWAFTVPPMATVIRGPWLAAPDPQRPTSGTESGRVTLAGAFAFIVPLVCYSIMIGTGLVLLGAGLEWW